MNDLVSILVQKLTDAGTDPALAASVVAEAFAAGATAAVSRTLRQERNARYYEAHKDKIKARQAARRVGGAVVPAVIPAKDLLGDDITGAGAKKKERARRRNGTRLPDDWKPKADDVNFAIAQGFTPDRIARVAASFKDYWLGRTGQIATKLDWSATWRNWVRSEIDRSGKRGPPSTQKSRGNGFASVAQELMTRQHEKESEFQDDIPPPSDKFDFDDGRTIEGTVTGRT